MNHLKTKPVKNEDTDQLPHLTRFTIRVAIDLYDRAVSCGQRLIFDSILVDRVRLWSLVTLSGISFFLSTEAT